MAEDITKILDENNVLCDVVDETSRAMATADTALADYDRQVENNVYAGRDIATLFADEIAEAGDVYKFLKARADANDYSGLRIRDYIDVPISNGYGTKRYRIGAFNHYTGSGDTPMGNNILMVPDSPVAMPSSSPYAVNGSYIQWNTTNTNQGSSTESAPYLISNLHAWEIGEFLSSLPFALQDVLTPLRTLVETRYSASGNLNSSTGMKYANLGKVFSPSEVEVYGMKVWGTEKYSQGADMQWPIFRECKDRVRGGRVSWWLRVVHSGSASYVCYCYDNGNAHYSSATSTWFRAMPCFLIG